MSKNHSYNNSIIAQFIQRKFGAFNTVKVHKSILVTNMQFVNFDHYAIIAYISKTVKSEKEYKGIQYIVFQMDIKEGKR